MPEATRQTADRSGLGQWLSQGREAKGVSLETAAEVTRISKGYIDALEREDFSRLPAPAYCKGFLRLYAVYLGLSADEAVARYDAMVSGSAVADKQAVDEPPPRESTKNNRRWLMPLVLLSVVLLVSIFVDTNQRPPVNRPAPQPDKAQAVRAVPVQPQLSSSGATATLSPTAPAPQPESPVTAAPVVPSGEPPQEGLILKLKVNQDSWLNVDIDGRFSKQYELKAGDLIEWKADSLITLDIGNSGGVEGELNGKPLPPFGASGKKTHVVLRPEGASIQ